MQKYAVQTIRKAGWRRWRQSASVCLTLTCLMLAAVGWTRATAAEAFAEQPVSAEQFAALRQGGFVLYMRHGSTDNSRLDAYPQVDLADCRTQRPLSDAGRALARQIGRNVQRARIPLDEVVHSPMCRARETAQLAFGGGSYKIRQELKLMYSGNMTSEEKVPVVAMTRHLLSEPVPPGTNRLLVAHAPNLADLMGYFIKPEGTIAIMLPLGHEQFRYVGSIHPDDWPRLLKSQPESP